MNDREIVELYWQRSERAISETAKKHGQYCRMVAYNILGDSQDSEECVNDTWLAAWSSMPSNRPSRLNPYLAKITRNFALQKIVYRTAKKRGGGEAELALEELDDCVPSGYCIENELEEKELSEAINRFVDRLSDEEQLAFIGRYWFLASEREIAQKQGCSRSKINATLKHTREKEKIESRDEVAQTEDWTCRIVETYCDDSKPILTASVTCDDRYIPVATDADGDLPASYCGFDYDGTLSEYAAKKDKELLLMNLGINDEKVGVVSASVHFENVSDHELLIMYSPEKSGQFDSIETSCVVITQDGTEYARLTMGEGQAKDTLTIHYYDWDKQLVGDLVFQRK